MASFGLRPEIAELVFHLYDQPLHPELFEVEATRTVGRPDYSVTVRITRSGHAISWDSARGHLTELATSADPGLPLHRTVVQRRMRGEHTATFPWSPGWNYQSSFQVETLPEEIFHHVHEEIVRDSLKRGMLHNFRPHNRLVLAPLGFVTIESCGDNLVVSAFHTFPDEFTIVKTQSLIERLS